MATPMLSAVLTLKSGEQREISYCVGSGGGKTQLNRTQESLVKLQGDVNAVLTELVDQERSANANTETVLSEGVGEDEEDNSDEDDSEIKPSSTSTEPVTKKQRSS